MRLAIADPPYLGRADRYYGNGRGYLKNGGGKPDFHPEAAAWDDPAKHVELIRELIRDYDGFALAGNIESLPFYMAELGDRIKMDGGGARIGVWHRPNAVPSGSRIKGTWEPCVFYIPEGRRGRAYGMAVDDTLSAPPPGTFVGSKPGAWTRWVLAMMGYDPATDEVVDLFAGSGAVAFAADGMLI
jgi:hypothetical protein